MKWRVTYEVVTPESSEHGDAEERGFIDARGLCVEAIIGAQTPNVEMTLRDALALCDPQEDCGRWLCEVDGSTDYQTGAVTTRALHPPQGITAASYRRLCRLVGVKHNG